MTKFQTRSNMIKPFATVPLVVVILLAAAGLYWFNTSAGKVESPNATVAIAIPGSLKASARGAMAAFLVQEPRKAIPAFSFKDATGADKTLADFKGRVILLNLWATWCAPCRKEMPDLAKLQSELGGPQFEVVALSIDRKGAEASAAFLQETGANSLALYTDTESKSLAAVSALGLPATILIDRDGMEAGRLLGPANWASDETKEMIRTLMK